MRGSVVPIKVISQIISAVPAIGELMIGLKKIYLLVNLKC
jgi:hypothetical protein